MKVMKFGGTSVGTPDRMKEVTELVTKSGEPVFVVLSGGDCRLPVQEEP